MTANEVTKNDNKVISAFREQSGRLIVLGIVIILLGAAGLYLLFSQTQLPADSVRYLGALFLVGGIIQLYDAYKAQQWLARGSHFATSLVYLGVGAIMIVFPAESTELLVMAVGVSLAVIGALRVLTALRLRKHLKRWVALLIAGLLSIGMGVMLIMQWPTSGEEMVVLLVSLELILQGLCLTYIATVSRSRAHT